MNREEFDASRPSSDGAEANGAEPQSSQPPARPIDVLRQRMEWLALRAIALLGSLLLLAGILVAGAGWYTSRPDFCRSCHNMEPYYKSWKESSHRDVSCIKCHFPPGFGEKVRGKMLGLVQLAKYVTETGGPRPAAEIPDASCLRSGCHETRLLSGRVDFHGVPFDHRDHLAELRRGKKLRCTSCHSQIVQGSHMTVTTSTCFLCHFKDGVFNEGLGACTRCHQIPQEEFDMGGGVTFQHDVAYERGVDCINCHDREIRGNGEVPHERCTVCHNREDDLARIDDHVFLHQKHVTEHKVDCLECHLEIKHSLDPHKIEHAASDCQSCHPDHHREQVWMLEGVGAKSLETTVGGMGAVRITCPACHRVKETSPTGTVLWKASLEACASCHSERDTEKFRPYYDQLQAALGQMESSLADIRKALETGKLPAERSASLASQIKDLEYDISFLKKGNVIHNIHYGTELSRAIVRRLTALCHELKIPEPKVTLPTTEKKTD
ncbi:MAG: hypothetical protein GXP27_05185 [Planctomycetes bacterium]|nr:hypothetical protein [Planctomycetota bacterium]